MSAQEVVAAHMLAGHVSHPDYDANPYADQEGPFIATPLCRCGRQVEDYPAHVLDALSANGFAVVELPKPNVDLEFESGMVVARPGFDRVRLYVEDDRLTAQDAHDLGCELIAASILSSRPAADRAGDDGEGR